MDAAAKLACAKEILDQAISYENSRTHIKHLIFQKWQNDWLDTTVANKLPSIRNIVYRLPTSTQSTQHYEVILARLHFGHTKFTHCHPMKTPHAHSHECETLLTTLTVALLLVDCHVHANSRRKFNIPT